MSLESRQIATLARKAVAGDRGALRALLEWLEPVHRGFFVKRIGPRPEVDDLVQNSMIRVSQSISELRDPSRFRGFALKAALFELHDFYRGRYSAKEIVDEEAALRERAPEPFDEAAAIDLERALRELSPHARRIIELREYGYRYSEIAAMVDSTEAAVKMQVRRAFEKLREILVCLCAFGLMLLLTRL